MSNGLGVIAIISILVLVVALVFTEISLHRLKESAEKAVAVAEESQSVARECQRITQVALDHAYHYRAQFLLCQQGESL